MTGAPILTAALELAAAGISVLPVRDDGTKAPATTWKTYTQTPATDTQIRTWFAPSSTHGLGLITGAVSGGLEMTELEGRAAYQLPDLRALAHDTGLGNLWDHITRGWVETSPSGGFHFHYRITGAPVPGNTKLARRPATPDELAVNPGDRIKVLAETRGEGGFVVVAPSPGTHHETGRPWVRLLGGPTTIATVTLEQRDAFHSIIRTLDETPTPTVPDPGTRNPVPRDAGGGISPGDDYENKTDWTDILIPHGWTHVGTRGRTRYWLRPGKTRGQGISATTGHADDRDRLYVFTSSTDFTPEVPYTKLGALAVLEHGGDHSAAARDLARQGFGQRAEQHRPTGGNDDLVGLIAPTADGTVPTPTEAPRRHLHVVPPTTYTETDDGNALRLVDAYVEHIRYCPQRGSWLTWDGHRWRWDEANAVRELARGIARELPQGDKTADRHRAVSLSRRGIEAMTALAQSDARTVTHLAALDARPYELNTPAGVVNLRTGQLQTPDPHALHTRSTTVAPDHDTEPTQWLAFLADTFAGDPDLTTYIQRLLGVSLVGQVLEQVLPFAHGPGANGKTTLAGVIQRLVGIGDDGYSISAPAEMLLATHQQGHPTEIARLSGARIVVTSELEDGQNFAEAKIKMLTGRDTISGRFMRQDWFSFTPTHTLWLLANHQPIVRAGGPAFWRRIRLLPFEHTVPPEQRIADLEDRLVDGEGPAILAWVIAGAADYFTYGLAEPASVLAATDAYATDQDTVGRFVAELCTTGDPNAQHMHVKVSDVRQAYETWCRTEGEHPVTAKALTTALQTRFGVRTGRDMHARYYSGIRLNDLSSEDPNPSSEPRGWQEREGW